MRKVLSKLLNVISHDVKEMEPAIITASRSHGIASLPDEMLTRILDFVGASHLWTQDWKYISRALRRIGVVSRRFRSSAWDAKHIQQYCRLPYSLTELLVGDISQFSLSPSYQMGIVKLSLISRVIVSQSKLAAVLRSLPNLSYFSIACGITKSYSDEIRDDILRCSLPRLRHLKIENGRHEIDTDADDRFQATPIGELVKNFVMPRLEEVILEGTLKDSIYDRDYLGADCLLIGLLGSSKTHDRQYASVHRVSFLVKLRGITEMNVSRIFLTFPNLRSLHLRYMPNVTFSLGAQVPSANLSQLKSLRMTTHGARKDVEAGIFQRDLARCGAQLEFTIIVTDFFADGRIP